MLSEKRVDNLLFLVLLMFLLLALLLLLLGLESRQGLVHGPFHHLEEGDLVKLLELGMVLGYIILGDL